jgi:hypothetical protein
MGLLAWRSLLLVGAAAGTACAADFEPPSIVVDLRILAIQADPPEVIIPDIDDDQAIDAELLDMLPRVQICALVADPARSRGLRWEMTACAPTNSLRCDQPREPFFAVAAGSVPDPEEADQAVSLCATLPPSPTLFEIVRQAVTNDPLAGFANVPVQIEVFILPERAGVDQAVYGSKRVIAGFPIPEDRRANANPRIREVRARRGANDPQNADQPVATSSCRPDRSGALQVRSGEPISFVPVATEDAQEVYQVPTFDGGTRTFTETLSYAWFATAGTWSAEETGGPPDLVGNQPHLASQWTAPTVESDTLVDLWVVQRDERGGLSWSTMCAAVAPH